MASKKKGGRGQKKGGMERVSKGIKKALKNMPKVCDRGRSSLRRSSMPQPCPAPPQSGSLALLNSAWGCVVQIIKEGGVGLHKKWDQLDRDETQIHEGP